jgi:hypothetical protein
MTGDAWQKAQTAGHVIQLKTCSMQNKVKMLSIEADLYMCALQPAAVELAPSTARPTRLRQPTCMILDTKLLAGSG